MRNASRSGSPLTTKRRNASPSGLATGTKAPCAHSISSRESARTSRSGHVCRPTREQPLSLMPMSSLARTILDDHLERGELVPGQEIALRVDQTLAQDATGTMACMQFELFGVDRVQVDTGVVYVDHNILQIDFKNPDDHRFLQAMAARYGLWFS